MANNVVLSWKGPPITTQTVPQVGHLIGGEAPVANPRDVHDPGRPDEVAAQVAVGTAEDVGRALYAAPAAFPGWRGTPAAGRVRKLLAAADVLAGRGEELAPLLVRGHGGVLWEAQAGFALGTGVLQHTSSLVEDFLRPAGSDESRASSAPRRFPGVLPRPSCRGTCRSS